MNTTQVGVAKPQFLLLLHVFGNTVIKPGKLPYKAH